MIRLRQIARGLFGSLGNAVLTATMLGFFAVVLPRLFAWGIGLATWVGTSRAGCNPAGACWPFVRAKLEFFLYGSFPAEAEWRVHVALAAPLACLAGAVLARRRQGLWLVALFCVVPMDAMLLLGGFAGLCFVPTVSWGGLMLNVTLAFLAVAISVPIGIALAFSRLSKNRLAAVAATAFIEFWRAVPLIAVLFIGVVLLPLFLPLGVTVDNLVRAALVLILFTSAYMAEVFRGGLQTVPRGQEEAAAALGLQTHQVALLVRLPQSMRLAVPGIVNIAVDIFKDTSLVSIVGLFDLVGVTAQSLKDPAWLGLTNEAYLLAASLFFICCLAISLCGQLVERQFAAPWRAR